MPAETAIAMAGAVVRAAELWGLAGLAVAAVFLAWGIDRVEPNARRSWSFRPLLVPGVVLLWPLVLWRWAVLEAGRDRPLARHRPPRTWHAPAAWALAVAVPLILFGGLLARETGPLERAPERIGAPR